MQKADGGKMYSTDIFALAVLNRSVSNIRAFIVLLENNFPAAAVMVRLQLDSLLRFFALHLVDNPHELASRILHGDQLDKIKDRSNQKMKDAYLRKKVFEQEEGIDWIESVYRETSGYVHLSHKHLYCMMEQYRAIGPDGKEIEVYNADFVSAALEAAECIRHTTELLLHYVHGWILTKEVKGQSEHAE